MQFVAYLSLSSLVHLVAVVLEVCGLYYTHPLKDDEDSQIQYNFNFKHFNCLPLQCFSTQRYQVVSNSSKIMGSLSTTL